MRARRLPPAIKVYNDPPYVPPTHPSGFGAPFLVLAPVDILRTQVLEK
jgi:hypothetical protein